MADKIVNTAQEAATSPMTTLVKTMFPGGIEASEAEGQKQLVESDVLPADLGGEATAFVALGFVIGDVVPGDEIFRTCQLPKGWTKRKTDHAMWSHIADENGVVRVKVFYKAAFYDRSARASLVKRYEMRCDDDALGAWYVYDNKTFQVVFRSVPSDDGGYDACRARSRALNEAGTFLEVWGQP